jgi:hypothetical protein
VDLTLGVSPGDGAELGKLYAIRLRTSHSRTCLEVLQP